MRQIALRFHLYISMSYAHNESPLLAPNSSQQITDLIASFANQRRKAGRTRASKLLSTGNSQRGGFFARTLDLFGWRLVLRLSVKIRGRTNASRRPSKQSTTAAKRAPSSTNSQIAVDEPGRFPGEQIPLKMYRMRRHRPVSESFQQCFNDGRGDGDVDVGRDFVGMLP